MTHQSLVQSRLGLDDSAREGRSLQVVPQRQVRGCRERLVDERPLRTTSSSNSTSVSTTAVLVGTWGRRASHVGSTIDVHEVQVRVEVHIL